MRIERLASVLSWPLLDARIVTSSRPGLRKRERSSQCLLNVPHEPTVTARCRVYGNARAFWSRSVILTVPGFGAHTRKRA